MDSYRHHPGRRVASEPDRYFFCEVILWHQGKPRKFRFTIDDATAPGYMLLVAAEETT